MLHPQPSRISACADTGEFCLQVANYLRSPTDPTGPRTIEIDTPGTNPEFAPITWDIIYTIWLFNIAMENHHF